MTPPPTDDTARRLRHGLFALFVAGSVGAAGELLLLEHTEDVRQWIPLALLALAVALGAWAAVAGSRAAVTTFQVVMALYVASAIVGTIWHVEASVEFELEMYPDLAGWALYRKAVFGASPPTLAPGAMMLLGAIGLLWTWRHPALGVPNKST